MGWDLGGAGCLTGAACHKFRMRGAAIFPLCERSRTRTALVLWRIRSYQMLCCAENRLGPALIHQVTGNSLK